MKILLTIVAGAWLASAAAVPHERRQNAPTKPTSTNPAAAMASLGSLVDSMMSFSNSLMELFADKPARVTTIEGEKDSRPGSVHKRYWYGPYDVPAGKVRL